MLVIFKPVLLTFVTFVPAICHSQNPIPEFSERISPRCAITWEIEGVLQSEMVCRQGLEVITESKDGLVTIGLRRSGRIVEVQREVKHTESVPEPVSDFIAWVQSCEQSGSCNIQEDMNGLFSTISLVNLDEGAWKFQLSSAKDDPDHGFSTYFFLAGEDLFAIRNTAVNVGPEISTQIFPYFVVEDVN